MERGIVMPPAPVTAMAGDERALVVQMPSAMATTLSPTMVGAMVRGKNDKNGKNNGSSDGIVKLAAFFEKSQSCFGFHLHQKMRGRVLADRFCKGFFVYYNQKREANYNHEACSCGLNRHLLVHCRSFSFCDTTMRHTPLLSRGFFCFI